MNSVASIVGNKERERKERANRYEKEKVKEKKSKDSKQFSGEVTYLIRKFEYNVFDLNSTNREVAKFILDYDNGLLITRAGDLNQQMDGYVYVEPFMYSIKFDKSEAAGRQSITKSSKFNKWKKALEDKFGVKIYFRREYSYHERYSNSGYRIYDDKIFQGVRVIVDLNG